MATQDTLGRERLPGNIVDRLFAAEERIARLEEKLLTPTESAVIVLQPETGGRWLLYVIDMGGEVGAVLRMKEL